MAILVTERWSGQSYVVSSDTLSAKRVFDVSGTTDLGAARDAVISEKGVDIDVAHPLNVYLKCRSLGVTEVKGPEFMVVTADYALPKTGEFGTVLDFLNRPLRITWRKEVLNIETDVDADGRLIRNSAGFPFRPKPTKPAFAWILSLKRNEPFFDIAKAQAFIDHTNSNAMQLGPISIGVRQALCECIGPSGEYQITAPWVEIIYEFRIDVNDTYPYEYQYVDEGRTGWCTKDSSKVAGPFVATDGSRLDEPVLLDGAGQPLVQSGQTAYKVDVGKSTYLATTTPPSTTNTLASVAIKNASDTTIAYKLIYRRHESVDFRPLGLI